MGLWYVVDFIYSTTELIVFFAHNPALVDLFLDIAVTLGTPSSESNDTHDSSAVEMVDQMLLVSCSRLIENPIQI